MKQIDWKAKFTSRKFWLAVIGFVTPLMIAFGASEASATQVASIIMAGGTLIAYIIGEGMVDSAHTPDSEDDGQFIAIMPPTDVEKEE